MRTRVFSRSRNQNYYLILIFKLISNKTLKLPSWLQKVCPFACQSAGNGPKYEIS